MAYDENLAKRLRAMLGDERKVTEKKMFGGLGFLISGTMCVSASRTGGLLVRIDPADSAAALKQPHASLMKMGGRSMNGWILVGPEGIKSDRALRGWVTRALEYAKSLPAK